ncbi:hypothetical protein BV20DRAFT_975958 [Pilatotrama ljubarskyi]|nr:hypothetical protein BV20DRAFT_975958 [Pilatotrama ljubarskyi]
MPPNSTRSWSCDWEAFTSQIMPPKPKYAKQMANGIEQNVEMYGPIKCLFLSDEILKRWKEEIGAYLAFITSAYRRNVL